ncbi:hypothetical protein MBAV_005913, partial [Candidatus Magnetobacterium bavaricum]
WGHINGLKLFTNNNLHSVVDSGTNKTCYYVYFMSKRALTFASQMVKVETLRIGDYFGDNLRGFHVYGYKVIRPEAFGVIYMTFQ